MAKFNGLGLLLVCALMALAWPQVSCKPLSNQKNQITAKNQHNSNEDPLIAMASDEKLAEPQNEPQQQQQYREIIEYVTQPSTTSNNNERSHQVRYVSADDNDNENDSPMAPARLPSPKMYMDPNGQLVYEVYEEAPAQQARPQAASSAPGDESNQDYVTEGPKDERDYPGEVIYVRQDGTQVSSQEAAQEYDQSAAEPANHQQAASSSGQTSVPATILTEVPLRDMPPEVLERLQQDYGVKVIATREHPGAGLTINCNDYSSSDISVCHKARRRQQQQQQQQQQSSYDTDDQQPQVYRDGDTSGEHQSGAQGDNHGDVVTDATPADVYRLEPTEVSPADVSSQSGEHQDPAVTSSYGARYSTTVSEQPTQASMEPTESEYQHQQPSSESVEAFENDQYHDQAASSSSSSSNASAKKIRHRPEVNHNHNNNNNEDDARAAKS